MTKNALLKAEKLHLAQLLEAIQRSVYFLHATTQQLPFPLQGEILASRKKEANLFQALSALMNDFQNCKIPYPQRCAMPICYQRKIQIVF